MQLAGFAGAGIMGLTLGLMGGGGSILTVPLLVYLFEIPGSAATYYSLFIVGLCAAIGTVPYAQRKLVDFKVGFFFLFPAMLGISISRKVLLPSIPKNSTFAGLHFSRDVIILISFGLVMMAAAWSMIQKKKAHTKKSKVSSLLTAFNGLFVGSISGFVGAGGGFLIVPALVNGVQIPMEKAIGTSLFIISMNSFFGFAGDWLSGNPAQWELIMKFSFIALLGIGAGTYLNPYIPGQKLKPLFGWFVLTLGSFILVKQMRDLGW